MILCQQNLQLHLLLHDGVHLNVRLSLSFLCLASPGHLALILGLVCVYPHLLLGFFPTTNDLICRGWCLEVLWLATQCLCPSTMFARCERLKKERERLDKRVYRVTPCSAALSLSKSFLGQTTQKTERTGARTERRPR